jgi:hypothetical protein
VDTSFAQKRSKSSAGNFKLPADDWLVFRIFFISRLKALAEVRLVFIAKLER